MPNKATPMIKQVAKRLLAHEAAPRDSAGANDPAAFRVCETLRRHLSRLTGVAGFRSLLSRALALASHEARWLKAVHVKADGALEGLPAAQAQLSTSEAAAGEFILVTQLLGLLVTFIGEGLTLRLVQEAWPKVALEDVHSQN